MAGKHWPECWRYASHHACAVAEVERLRAALEKAYKVALDTLGCDRTRQDRLEAQEIIHAIVKAKGDNHVDDLEI